MFFNSYSGFLLRVLLGLKIVLQGGISTPQGSVGPFHALQTDIGHRVPNELPSSCLETSRRVASSLLV